MSLFSLLLAIAGCIGLIAWILFVIFGQVTVRKLRKNPETKDELGVQFIHGTDILNVALALTLPKKEARGLNKSVFNFLHPDPDLLYKHTTRFDRILAKVFFIPFMFASFFLIVLCLMEYFGFFKQ